MSDDPRRQPHGSDQFPDPARSPESRRYECATSPPVRANSQDCSPCRPSSLRRNSCRKPLRVDSPAAGATQAKSGHLGTPRAQNHGLRRSRERPRKVTGNHPPAGSSRRDALPRDQHGRPATAPGPIGGRPRGPAAASILVAAQPPPILLEPAPEEPRRNRASAARTTRRLGRYKGAPSPCRTPSGGS
ncbi:hypothetical protein KM043_016108 [Ampulex compressa]|nr:hypothetical protein KM043_016108 [Ampulex compressa]